MFTKNHFSGGVSNQICLCFTSHSDNLFRKMQNLYLKGIFVFRTRQFNAKSLLRIEWFASMNVILCLCCKDFFPGDIICPFWVHADVRPQTWVRCSSKVSHSSAENTHAQSRSDITVPPQAPHGRNIPYIVLRWRRHKFPKVLLTPMRKWTMSVDIS